MSRRQPQRGPAQILIKGLIPLYLKPTAIVNILIKEGLSYRRQNMFIDVDLHIAHYKTNVAARDFDFFSALPDDLIIHTPFKNDRTYRVLGMATFENRATGLPEAQVISYYTDRNVDGMEQEEEALEQFGREDYEKDLVMVGFERQGMWKNTGTIWEKIKLIKPL